jgi:prevent-host-death family protein
MTKSYSIAEARAHLSTIVDAVSDGDPVELTRRGKPVAVVLSLQQYDLLTSKRPSFAEAYRSFLERFSLDEVGLEPEFHATLRDASAGRRVDL